MAMHQDAQTKLAEVKSGKVVSLCKSTVKTRYYSKGERPEDVKLFNGQWDGLALELFELDEINLWLSFNVPDAMHDVHSQTTYQYKDHLQF